MTITSHQIQSVLRTYSKQLRRGLRLNRIRQIESAKSMDKISISSEARRRQVVERVAAELMARLGGPGAADDDVAGRVMDSLSGEFGQPLQLEFDEETGRFDFDVLDEKTGAVVRRLEGEDKENMNSRLVTITEQVVDETMFKG